MDAENYDHDIGEELLQIAHPNKQKIPASKYGLWETLKLSKSDTGYPRPNIDNALKILENHPDMQNLLWYDTFHKKQYTRWKSDITREWSDTDNINLTRWMQDTIGIHNMPDKIVHLACMAYSQSMSRNEPYDWMEKLAWDGEERLPLFLNDCMEAEDNEFIRAVSQNLWIAMVARIYQPGCKYDNMIVLIGGQGTFKSSSLGIIGGKWFAELHESVMNPNFFMALHGKLLVEIAELDSFSKAETSRIKTVISCATDRYRTPYARTSQDHPRSCIFIGTTNEDQFLQDSTGGRRFWPVKIGYIRTDLIKANRDQYFAEAAAKYKRGTTWYNVPIALARQEQENRRISDDWESVVGRYLVYHGTTEITTTEILSEIIKLELSKQTKWEQIRIGKIMTQIGWRRKQRREGKIREWYWTEDNSA